MNTLLTSYLQSRDPAGLSSAGTACIAALASVAEVAPDIAAAIVRELKDQRSHLKLIASENFCSLPTQLAMGNWLTDKYAEGYARHRFYAGCDTVDDIEETAMREACALFGADHAYVQPHSGADANLIAYWAILNARVQAPLMAELNQKQPMALSREEWNRVRTALGNQRLLGLDYYCGGHLTHGYRFNVSAQMFDAYTYEVDPETGLLDYDALAEQAREVKPLILLAGYSAYPRKIDFRRMRAIADDVGAVLMVDMAHFAGLVAGGVFTGDFNPVAHAHVVTATTHKTLRGPRGGLVLSTDEFSEYVNKGCPMVMGGPLPHVMAAKAVALREAARDEFRAYAQRIVDNARALAAACIKKGLKVATGGTDNHLFLVDVRPQGITGRQAESALRDCGITLNRNALPFDTNGPWYTSGLRIGSPAITTLGMGPDEMTRIADVLADVLQNTKPALIEKGPNAGQPGKARFHLDATVRDRAHAAVRALNDAYPLYPEIDLPFLEEHLLQAAKTTASGEG